MNMCAFCGIHPQVGVHAGHLRVRDGLRKTVEPALRLPLERIFTPDGLVAVRVEQTDDDNGVLLEEYLLDGLAVRSYDRFGEGKDDVLACPAKGI